MALKLGNKDTRTVKIDAKEPGDLDKTTAYSFTAEFKILSTDTWRAELGQKDRLMIDAMLDNLVNIDGLVDEDGEPLSFCEEVKTAILDARWLHQPLIDAFIAVQGGMTMKEYQAAKLKN